MTTVTEHFSSEGARLRAQGYHSPDSLEVGSEPATELTELFNRVKASFALQREAARDTVVDTCRTCDGATVVHHRQDGGTGLGDLVPGRSVTGKSEPCPDCSSPDACSFCGCEDLYDNGAHGTTCPRCELREEVANAGPKVLAVSRCVTEALKVIRAPIVPLDLLECSARRVIFAERAGVQP